MLATITLLLCIGASCEQIRVPVAVTSIECAIHGQQIALDWLRAHPMYAEHRLRAWKCDVGEKA